MKTALTVVISLIVILGIGYFGLPVLIQKETETIKADVQNLTKRLQQVEEFVKKEEEIKGATKLQSDADMQKVISVLNTSISRLNSLEDIVQKSAASTGAAIKETEEAVKSQKTAAEEAFKKQTAAIEQASKKNTAAIEEVNKNIQAEIKQIMFDANMAVIRGRILKARQDLLFKNITTAKTELDLIHDAFEKAKASAPDKKKKGIEELQAILKKARVEIDTDLPATINRIDLLWHDMGKLLGVTS